MAFVYITADRPMDAQIQGIALASGDDAAYLAVSGGRPGERVRALIEDPRSTSGPRVPAANSWFWARRVCGWVGAFSMPHRRLRSFSRKTRGSSIRELAVEEIGLPENADLPNEEGTQASLLADHDAERHCREAAVLVRLAPRLVARLERLTPCSISS